MKKIDHNIGFWEKRLFFRRQLAKISENNDHNIDPRCQSYDFKICNYNASVEVG
jgi:hypothetical protein